MSVTRERQEHERQAPPEDTPEVEVRDWGSYGDVFIETGNTGGYILVEDAGNDPTVSLEEMR